MSYNKQCYNPYLQNVLNLAATSCRGTDDQRRCTTQVCYNAHHTNEQNFSGGYYSGNSGNSGNTFTGGTTAQKSSGYYPGFMDGIVSTPFLGQWSS